MLGIYSRSWRLDSRSSRSFLIWISSSEYFSFLSKTSSPMSAVRSLSSCDYFSKDLNRAWRAWYIYEWRPNLLLLWFWKCFMLFLMSFRFPTISFKISSISSFIFSEEPIKNFSVCSRSAWSLSFKSLRVFFLSLFSYFGEMSLLLFFCWVWGVCFLLNELNIPTRFWCWVVWGAALFLIWFLEGSGGCKGRFRLALLWRMLSYFSITSWLYSLLINYCWLLCLRSLIGKGKGFLDDLWISFLSSFWISKNLSFILSAIIY